MVFFGTGQISAGRGNGLSKTSNCDTDECKNYDARKPMAAATK